MSTAPPPPPPSQPEEPQPSAPTDPPSPNAPGQPAEPMDGSSAQQPVSPQHQPPQGYAHPPQDERQQGAQPYGSQPYGHQPAGAGAPLSESEEKTWTVLAHLSAPIAALVSVGMLNFVGPLVIWALYKDRSGKVRHASAGAFNFNLTLWLIYALLLVLSIVSLGLLLIITVPVGIVVWVGSMVLHIMAAVKASNGETYTYPAQIKVLK